jgi:hypothetical protein
MAFMLGLMGIAGVAQAANSPLIVWNGAITITSLSAQCASLGFDVGQLVPAVYRPRLVADEPSTSLALFTTRSAQVYFRTSGNDQMVGKGNYGAHLISPRATFIPNSNTSSYTGAYNFKVKPGVITDTTGDITIVGQLTNFFNASGCTMKFLGAFQPRP